MHVEAITAWFGQYNAAINAGDLERWSTLVAADAVVLPPDELPIAGMDGLRPLYETVFGTYAFSIHCPSGRGDRCRGPGCLASLVRGDSDAQGLG